MRRLCLAGLTPFALGACASLAGLSPGGGADGGTLDAGHDCGACKTPHDATQDVADAKADASRRDSSADSSPDSSASDGTSRRDGKVATDAAPEARTSDAPGADTSTHDATGIDATHADGHVARDSSTHDASHDGTDAPQPTITWRGTSTAYVTQTGSTFITVPVPQTTLPGDVLIASVAMGRTNSPSLPTFTAPTGWNLVSQVNDAFNTTLGVYWHLAVTGDPASYRWSFSEVSEGESWISDYSGVDPTTPIDAHHATVDPTVTTSYQTQAITTISAHSVVLATFASHSAATSVWTAPALTKVRASLNDGTTRAAIGVELAVPSPETVGPLTATIDNPQDYALTEVLALRPAP